MGLGILGSPSTCFRQKNRWMFSIPNLIGVSGPSSSIPMLPPSKAARPNIELKEVEVRHINETVYYPMKPDWKPLQVTLYHIGAFNNNPIYNWLLAAYNPTASLTGTWSPSVNSGNAVAAASGNPVSSLIQPYASLDMYDGCGGFLENWTYEVVWPQTIDWDTLDMETGELVYINLTLRYARAYFGTSLGLALPPLPG